MINRIFLAFLILIFFVEFSYAECKNLYILIEPTSAMDAEDASQHILIPSLENSKNIVKWIVKNRTRPKFRNIFIRVVGYKTELFKQKDIGVMLQKGIFNNIYKSIKMKKEYSITNGLSHFSQDLEGNGWRGDETMLLVIGDIDFVKNGVSSHGKYLNSAWLTNKQSPFVRDFLKRDNTIAKDTSVVIFTRTQLNLKDEKRREDFLINLFSKAGMRLYYVGDYHNNFIAKLRDDDVFAIKMIDRVRLNKQKHIEVSSMMESNLCQIVGKEAMTIKNCGR